MQLDLPIHVPSYFPLLSPLPPITFILFLSLSLFRSLLIRVLYLPICLCLLPYRDWRLATRACQSRWNMIWQYHLYFSDTDLYSSFLDSPVTSDFQSDRYHAMPYLSPSPLLPISPHSSTLLFPFYLYAFSISLASLPFPFWFVLTISPLFSLRLSLSNPHILSAFPFFPFLSSSLPPLIRPPFLPPISLLHNYFSTPYDNLFKNTTNCIRCVFVYVLIFMRKCMRLRLLALICVKVAWRLQQHVYRLVCSEYSTSLS